MNERVGDKYAFLQLLKAQAAGNQKKISQWKDVLSGILTGDLRVGSRTPVSNMPAWATPQVIRGGFATGNYAAGGPLLEHEKELASKIGLETKSIPIVREAINTWYLTDDGIIALKQLITERRFSIQLPEEAALMSVALLADDDRDGAANIVKIISPFFDRLRFYPRPIQQTKSDGIHVRNIDQVRAALAHIAPRKEIQIQAATLEVWIPLYDRLIDLLADTNTENWKSEAKQWQKDFENTDKTKRSKRWSDQSSPFERCRQALEQKLCSKQLNQTEAKYVSLVIGRHKAKHGEGATRESNRAAQAAQNVRVWFDEVAEIIFDRTTSLDGEDGVDNPEIILFPISEIEARYRAPAQAEIPSSIKKRVISARKGSIGELIDGGQISSPEVLAEVLPQITASVHATSVKNREYASVYSETYKAFHRRRSLLLLNLESQVRFSELPWAQALSSLRKDVHHDEELSCKAMSEFVLLSLTYFPQTQFPNPFVEQLQDLRRRANTTTPFVPELAADIFMGRFSPRFEAAAKTTVSYFQDKLYGRYYNLPNRIENGSFDRLCHDRAEKPSRQGWSIAQNGTVLEQAMILTSHNMATVFSELELSELDFAQSAKACLNWICHRLALSPATYHAELISIKNSAYAWRQMVALLSELEDTILIATFNDLEAILSAQENNLQIRLHTVFSALKSAAIKGTHIEDRSQQFLGWTLGKHPQARS